MVHQQSFLLIQHFFLGFLLNVLRLELIHHISMIHLVLKYILHFVILHLVPIHLVKPEDNIHLELQKKIHTVGSLHGLDQISQLSSPDSGLSHIFRSANYRIISSEFEDILRIASDFGIYPNMDAFSSHAHKRLPDYWSAHTDAFDKNWYDKILWIYPPISQITRIIEKIFRDEACGIILVPVWPECKWFVSLNYITVQWWNLPHDKILFEDPKGLPLPSKLFPHFRVVIFDAYECQKSISEDGITVFHTVNSLFDHTIHWADQSLQVSGAIESASPHPKSKILQDELRRRYDDVM